MQAPDLFAEIRPYNDLEVSQVLQRLLASKELHQALLGFYSPWLPATLRSLFAPVLRYKLNKQLKYVKTVAEFQQWLTRILDPLLRRTSSTIEVRGLDKLTPGKAYLWISNHRDIAMDPLMINYSLYHDGWPTSRIAIGDNLLSHPDVADIMRLNKSFIVKRNIESGRQRLRELQKLSAYIRHSIENGVSIWLAHKEGRAKDGVDKTDTAVLKMLALHGRSTKEDFTTSMTALNPVPVCIQYEWDPCDLLKAKELVAVETNGSYQKSANEDTQSILLGLIGYKGRIIVDFGEPLTTEELKSPDTMAQGIDTQIAQMQEIAAINRTALALLQKTSAGYAHCTGGKITKSIAAQFSKRLQDQPKAVQERVLKTYAMPLLQANKKTQD